MVTFTSIHSPHLYHVPVTVPATPYSVGFWALSASPANIADSSESLTDAWHQPGVYLFLKAALTGDAAIDRAQFSDRLQQFLAVPSVKHTRFLWIENPADPVSAWRFTALPTLASVGDSSVQRLTFFTLRNYRLAIARHVTCRLNEAGDAILFSRQPALHNAPAAAAVPGKTDPCYLTTDYGEHRLRQIEEAASGEAIRIPLTGAQAGSLVFTLTVQNRHPDPQPFEELTHLNIGLKVFYPSADFGSAGTPTSSSATDAATTDIFSDQDPFSGFATLNTADQHLTTHHHYPLLQEDGRSAFPFPQLTLQAVFDPLFPLNGDRTYFTFVPETTDPVTAPVSLPSCYRTNLGYTVHLHPAPFPQSRLIFAERPGQTADNFVAPLYLVPQGEFTLSVPRYDTLAAAATPAITVQSVDNLLCGLAGIEYIELSSTHPNRLLFRAGSPAFTPDFVPGQVADETTIELRFDAAATTAWAAVEYAAPQTDGAASDPNLPTYFSQPIQSLLYRASDLSDGDEIATNDPLRFLDVPVARLPADEYLPMFPYGGVSGRLVDYRQLEEQLLNPQRRQRIRAVENTLPLVSETPAAVALASPPGGDRPPALQSPLAPGPAPARAATAAAPVAEVSTITGTTPQGLLCTYTNDFERLSQLVLAKDTDNEVVGLRELIRRSPLRSAFQSSQLFLVVTNPESLAGVFPDNQLTIQGWTFDLDPENWRTETADASDTILIFKFLDQPLIEILPDTALWEQPSHFVGETAKDVQGVSDRLVQFFQAAIDTVASAAASESDKSNAAPLARIATSELWSGWVALNVNLPPKGLPAELQALECGIQGDFYAQYVGSNGTPVVPENRQLAAKQSSLFGLLDYEDNSVPETGPSGYAFQVATLRVQFQNSQIADFSSDVNLTLDQLFAERTLLLNSPSNRNIVILKGFTEEHDGEITYAFSFSGENFFALPFSHVLHTVDIVKAEFATDTTRTDKTVGKFLLWGQFNFQALPELDLFSFGMEASEQGEFDFRDFQNNPQTIALEALEELDLRDVFATRKAQLEALPEGDPQAIQALEQAQAVVAQYEELVVSGDSIRDGIGAIEVAALNALQDLRRLDPDSLNSPSKLVQSAVRASKVDRALQALDDNEQFLRFSQLSITMECDDQTPPTFTFDASQIAFDLKKSQPRSQSLYGKFPLKLVEFVTLNDETAAPKGFVSVKTPLRGTSLPSLGFGFKFEINLGSLGELSGSAKFVANLLMAWAPNTEGTQDQPQIFVGFRLPGIGGDPLGFPLQSVLKLSFKQVELLRDLGAEEAAYLLKIQKIALKFFVLKFPPNGQTELVIFGNPDAEASNDAVGWYAAYAKEPAPLPEGQATGRASPRRRSR
ncbi:MAG: hypothetical protein F6K00_20860 [Leptolyngbya sp. SIOISBB]|nr:hypothetical protein [Leptolyngbya sp. SIOISBB]